ncbi:hypothetical protein TNCV_1582641 [Trichonephila clavipes]|nr:hypothetical protein TNCV_1582641 [Trichonephila clavipes]
MCYGLCNGMYSDTSTYSTPTYTNSELHNFQISSIHLFFSPITETQVESVLEPDEISNLIEEVIDLARQINLVVDSVGDVKEMLDSHNQELTIDELIEMHEQDQDIEELESLNQGYSTFFSAGPHTGPHSYVSYFPQAAT